MDQAIRHSANQAQETSLRTAENLAHIYDLVSRKHEGRERTVRQKTSAAYLARYCELEREWLAERGVLTAVEAGSPKRLVALRSRHPLDFLFQRSTYFPVDT
jgi:hypothetical protein